MYETESNSKVNLFINLCITICDKCKVYYISVTFFNVYYIAVRKHGDPICKESFQL